MEIIGSKPRALMSVLVAVYYTAGSVMVGALSYFVRSWRVYALLTSLPMLLLLFAFLWFPESPRWLLSEKRYTELAHMLEDIVEVNGNGSLDEEDCQTTVDPEKNQ
ncbi:hypothetical protein RvY_12900 [Ramazzottius varieornatus]|uniref:Major facilitator superfamily (MFS) profile domain-containing protein n=1 Tax=Ramazzottius varieornatus TaxID=947166 RepID=A0A1D1VL21_RAMVA|nr:hypothetical protein RvY_12900 [Ramazzottius varieornatus]